MKSIKYVLFAAAVMIFSIIGCKKNKEASTVLDIHLIDNQQGLYIEGASVKLYQSQSDMENDTNQIGATLTSNATGEVVFTNLSPKVYYWFAEKGCQNNINGIITTEALDQNMTRDVTSTLINTGTLELINTSTDQYQVMVDGSLLLTADGGYDYTYSYIPEDIYYIEVIQVNGSGDETSTDQITCGNTTTVTFP